MLHRKRILFAINSLAGGGAERVLATLLGGSTPWRERYDIHLALLDDEPRAYDVPEWVEVHQLDARHKFLPSLTQLRALVGRLSPDATLSFLTRANVANAWAMAGRGRPWLISERVNTSAHLGSARAAKAMVRMVYPRAAHVIAVSDGVVDDLAANFGVARARMSSIANPVDHERIAKLAAEQPSFTPPGPYIVAAGRLMPNKNFPLLLRAYAKAAPLERLVLLGEGPERGALEALAASLGIADRVDMPGFVANPFAVVARAEAYAMPSNAEGFPNGLVEAMACGLPVVATNCASGPSEILADRPRETIAGAIDVDAGALVPTNDVEAFAAALGRVLAEPRRSACGVRARERSRAYGVEQAARNYWERIEAALAASSAASEIREIAA
ncbi:N-acetylgalactosamine-N,N'-diacetylbacillosaminyl-diphospho-undecaprenol 4-alpha-N-acetylgalactosaminyltransferase [Sphingopyxis sp. OAS728]|uniref:glycosyltransferase n=1 Tax=Sphingopyxis sp. OAS728 TaxID=2663823 RepID=UPI0017890182|nr:glycosyltransferase [Sphingopyxis sp. OAS728]MBE1527225.1 N-acetylgalactosamine-N,N'-diacetylbacillosaminyl-diphospho-undecaprenol 4-alpha-N-acetylgalactosaminyltransferase [Sphingopyxis sp. OAS728]